MKFPHALIAALLLAGVAAHVHAAQDKSGDPTTRPGVETLDEAWRYDTPDLMTATPVVENGRVYFGDWAGNAYALDAATGEEVWKKSVHRPENTDTAPWYGFTGSGAMAGDVFVLASAAGGGFAYGLDADTGEVRWETKLSDNPYAGNIGQLGYDEQTGHVFVGIASYEELLTKLRPDFEPGFKGSVIALDAETGEKAFEIDLAPEGNGAGVWSGFAFDDGRVFFTTSNSYTELSPLNDSIVAADAETGRIEWALQVTQNDLWTYAQKRGPDYAFASPPVLAEHGGATLVIAGDKSGRVFAVDAADGRMAWFSYVGYGGVGGGVHGTAAVEGDRVFVWSNNSYQYGKPAGESPMDVAAVKLDDGMYDWINPTAQPASTTGGGAVAAGSYFVPCLDGVVRGYAIADGKLTHAAKVPTGSPTSTGLVAADGLLLSGGGLNKEYAPNPGTFKGIVAWKLP